MVAQNEKQTKTFETKVLKAEEGERAVVARISTIIPDRDGDVMLPSGMDSTNFRNNPIVMFSHGLDKKVGTMPVGAASELQQGHKFISAKMTFAERPESLPPTVEWLPDTLLSLFQQKVLRAFSVGMIPKRVRIADAKDISRFGEDTERVIMEWELLEFSIASVGTNQEALAMAVSKGINIGSDLPKLWDIRGREKLVINLAIKSKIKIEIPPKVVISLN